VTEPSTPDVDTPQVAGILAEFDDPEALKAGAAGARRAGYTRFEAYSPFPVHGIDAAMGRRRTALPWLVLAGGIGGGLVALGLQWWTNAVDYPHIISGKPLFSLPANIPITFELIILLSARAAFGGGLVLSGLPRLFHPLVGSTKFRRVTTDAFFLTVEADDPKFDEAATAELLRSLGAGDVEVYHRPQTRRKIPGLLVSGVVVLIALALLPPLWIAQVRYSRKSSPRVHVVSDMDFQPKYLPQQASPLFADGRGMRPPVEGAVAVDQRIDDDHFLAGEVDGQPATEFPLPVTPELMRRGRPRYDIYCATCHGLAGEGDGITSQLAFEREEPKWVRPLAMHDPSVREQPVGKLFKTISDGVRRTVGDTTNLTMPSYASQIPVEDRWAIVLYVRALQRSQNATIEDVPPERRKYLELTEQDDAGKP
jgi:mono/diheme cytochrome c family protein